MNWNRGKVFRIEEGAGSYYITAINKCGNTNRQSQNPLEQAWQTSQQYKTFLIQRDLEEVNINQSPRTSPQHKAKYQSP